MRIPLAICYLLSAICSFGADVLWQSETFTGTPLSNRLVYITPIANYSVSGSRIISGDRQRYTNDATGSLIVSNLTVARSYRVEFIGPYITTIITNSFPANVTGYVNAADFVAGQVSDGNFVGYSQATADLRFHKTSAGSSTNATFRGTVKIPEGATVGYVFTVTNSDGSGAWQPPASGVDAGLTNQWQSDAALAAQNATNKLKSDIAAGSVPVAGAAVTGTITNNTTGNAATATTITNSTAELKVRNVDLTNGGWAMTFATNSTGTSTSNSTFQAWPQTGTVPGGGFGWYVGSAYGYKDLFDLWINTRHGAAEGEGGSADASEVQFATVGHTAHAPGYQSGKIMHDQIGIGLQNRRSGGQSFNQWAYRQAAAPYNGDPGYSYADTWRTRMPSQDYYPGIIGRAYTNDFLGFGGYYDLGLMRNLNVSVGSKFDLWDITNIVDGASLYYFTNDAMRGFRHWGAFVQTTKSTTVSGAAIPLDFGGSTHQRLNISQAQISFYTTNVFALSSNFQRVVFHIPGSGLNVTSITYPSWLVTTNVSAPAGIPQGYFMRLEVESFGIGDTNKVLVSAGVGPDSTFSFDSDAQAYFARASGLPNAIRSNAVNNLVLNLKATNLWTKIDALYPFAGTDATDNAQNLKSASFTGSFTGTPAQTDGFVADGSDDFMATGFTPSTAGGNYTQDSAHVAVYTTSTTMDDLDRLLGVYDSAGGIKGVQLRRNSTTMQVHGPNNNTYTTGAAHGSDYTGFMCGSRTASGTAWIQVRTTQTSGASTSSALPTKQIYIGANNNDGTAASFTAAHYRCVSIGGGLTTDEMNALKWCIEQYVSQMP